MRRTGSPPCPHRIVPFLRRFLALSARVALAGGCLDRPVAPAKPNTTNVFVKPVAQTFVNKIDLLFMIDNSLSMKDKQGILENSVPVLVQRLVTPRCLDAGGNTVGPADANGRCAMGSPNSPQSRTSTSESSRRVSAATAATALLPMPEDAATGHAGQSCRALAAGATRLFALLMERQRISLMGPGPGQAHPARRAEPRNSGGQHPRSGERVGKLAAATRVHSRPGTAS